MTYSSLCNTTIIAWLSNYIPCFNVDVILYLPPNLEFGSTNVCLYKTRIHHLWMISQIWTKNG